MTTSANGKSCEKHLSNDNLIANQIFQTFRNMHSTFARRVIIAIRVKLIVSTRRERKRTITLDYLGIANDRKSTK